MNMMKSDRLTEIQDKLDEITELFFTTVGVLQRDAPLISVNDDIPVTLWTSEQVEKNQQELSKFSKEMSVKLIEKFKSIDNLIDSLPGKDETKEEKFEKIQALDKKNFEVELKYKEKLTEAENLNEKLKGLIESLIDAQYKIQES